MSTGKKGQNIQAIALFIYLYAAVVLALWLLGTVGEPFTLGPLIMAVVSLVPVLVVSTIWWLSHTSYNNEAPDVERLRKTLQVEKLQSEGIIAALDDAVCIINQEGIVKHVNAKFLEYVNSSETEFINHHFTEPISVNKRVRVVSSSVKQPLLSQNIATVFQTGKSIVIERERIEYTDGTKAYDLAISLLPLKNESGIVSALMIIGHDISDLIRTQNLKDEFIATASHELRTPATAVIGYLDLLFATEFSQLNEKQQSYIREAKSSTNRLVDLINDMIDMTSLEAGKFGNNPVPVQMETLVQQMLIDISKRHDDKYIKTSADVAVPTITVDEQRIRAVLRQMIDNAFKFTPDKGAVTVRVIPDGMATVVEIADTGPSIPEEKREHIFEKFTKLDDTGAISGTGLGLSICRRIIDDWGGDIRISTQEGGGTVFSFTIPETVTAQTEPTSPANSATPV